MNFRSDLALEQADQWGADLPQGIQQEQRQVGNVQIDHIRVTDQQGAALLQKPMGSYITATLPPFGEHAELSQEELQALAGELQQLLPREGLVLVVGLGNRHMTPDALGPLAADGVLATRHIQGELAKATGLDQLRPVAVLSPGVLGQTGVESAEIIASMAQELKPAAVIAMDALAARNPHRLGCAIQMADSGIAPGSGVLNRRRELSRQTLGVPVVSMGVPTVIDVPTLLADHQVQGELPQRLQTLMVTPREVDLMIQRSARALSLVVNRALQPDVPLEDLAYLTS